MRLEMRDRRVCRTLGVLGSGLSLLREGKATLWGPAQVGRWLDLLELSVFILRNNNNRYYYYCYNIRLPTTQGTLSRVQHTAGAHATLSPAA